MNSGFPLLPDIPRLQHMSEEMLAVGSGSSRPWMQRDTVFCQTTVEILAEYPEPLHVISNSF